MRRILALGVVGICVLAIAVTVLSTERSPRSSLPRLTPDLAWKNFGPHIQLAMAHSRKVADAQTKADFERWIAGQMSKADAKDGFLDSRLNYFNERREAISWGWEWLKHYGDREEADRTHLEAIAKEFAALVKSPEQVERDLRAMAQRNATYFVTALAAELDAMRRESGTSAEVFSSRLSSLELVPGESQNVAVTLASIANPSARDTASLRLYEPQHPQTHSGPVSATVVNGLVLAIGAAQAGASVTSTLKTLGASSKVSVGAGYAAAAILVVAVAYDGIKHHWTYEERRKHLRQEVEAGLRTFGQEVLVHHAGQPLESATRRVALQMTALAI